MGIFDEFDERELSLEQTLSAKGRQHLVWMQDVYEEYCTRFTDEIDNQRNYPLALEHVRPYALDAEDVENFCFKLKDYEEQDFFDWKAGSFVSALVQRSIECGAQDVYVPLYFLNEPLDFVCAQILGNGNQPTITVKGDVGHHFGKAAHGINFIVQGSTLTDCGIIAQQSTFIIHGNASDYMGCGARHCEFTLHGKGDAYLTSAAKHTTFTFMQDVDYLCARKTEGCTFYFHGAVGKESGQSAITTQFFAKEMETLRTLKRNAYSSCKYYHLLDTGYYKEVFDGNI